MTFYPGRWHTSCRQQSRDSVRRRFVTQSLALSRPCQHILTTPPPALARSCVLTLHSARMSRQISLKNSWRWRCTRRNGSHRRDNHKAKVNKHSRTPQSVRNSDSFGLQHWQDSMIDTQRRTWMSQTWQYRMWLNWNVCKQGRRHGFVFVPMQRWGTTVQNKDEKDPSGSRDVDNRLLMTAHRL